MGVAILVDQRNERAVSSSWIAGWLTSSQSNLQFFELARTPSSGQLVACASHDLPYLGFVCQLRCIKSHGFVALRSLRSRSPAGCWPCEPASLRHRCSALLAVRQRFDE